MAQYIHSRLRELEKQLLLSPPQVRRRHADRLEMLLSLLDPQADYPYEFIYFRTTGFRPPHASPESYRGSDLWADLALLLDRVSQSAPTDTDEVPEQVLSIEEVSSLYNVAPRTVHRWRSKGLISRRYTFPGGRRRSGVRKGALEDFVKANPRLVERAGQFSRLSEAEREEILGQARALVGRDRLSRTAAAELIARRVGRAKETVRQALWAAIGSVSRGRLPIDQRLHIYHAYRSGQSVGTLCTQFRRSRSSIHRIINEARGRALIADPSVPGQFIADEEFTLEGAQERILSGGTEQPGAAERYTGDLFGTGPLDAEQEGNLFRRYNYLKYKTAQLEAKINPKRYVPARLLDEIEALMNAVRRIKQRLVEANLTAVEEVARKHAGRLVALEDLLREGTLILGQAIDTFDYRTRGRFGGYARWTLMRSFARTLPEEHYQGT